MTTNAPITFPVNTSPAALFGLLWPRVEARVSQIIQEPWDPAQAAEYNLFYGKLIGANGPQLPDDLVNYLAGVERPMWETPPADMDRRAFLIMRVIDRAFRLVLPETAYHFAGAVCVKPGELMRRMRDVYLTEGHLAETDAGYVVLLGPMTSGLRAEAPEARNGDVFEHQFLNLTMVPHLGAGRSLSFCTLAPSQFLPAPKAEELVGVAPIAQDENDLAFATCERGSSCFLDAVPSDTVVTSERAVATVSSMLADGAQLIALPELALDAPTVSSVRSHIRSGTHDGARVLVLGTGLSEETNGVKPQLRYNEAMVCDGRGKELFRQRKLHHYSMTADRMRECKIPPARDIAHIENSASGEILTICDLPGMGRLMVLICEDFAQNEPGRATAQRLSPDWIITPILDVALTAGRWPQQKAFSLGTAAKIVVCGSTTLSVRAAGVAQLDKLDPASGVAMFFDGRSNAASHIVTVGCMTGTHASALVAWAPPTWKKVRMTLR